MRPTAPFTVNRLYLIFENFIYSIEYQLFKTCNVALARCPLAIPFRPASGTKTPTLNGVQCSLKDSDPTSNLETPFDTKYLVLIINFRIIRVVGFKDVRCSKKALENSKAFRI